MSYFLHILPESSALLCAKKSFTFSEMVYSETKSKKKKKAWNDIRKWKPRCKVTFLHCEWMRGRPWFYPDVPFAGLSTRHQLLATDFDSSCTQQISLTSVEHEMTLSTVSCLSSAHEMSGRSHFVDNNHILHSKATNIWMVCDIFACLIQSGSVRTATRNTQLLQCSETVNPDVFWEQTELINSGRASGIFFPIGCWEGRARWQLLWTSPQSLTIHLSASQWHETDSHWAGNTDYGGFLCVNVSSQPVDPPSNK